MSHARRTATTIVDLARYNLDMAAPWVIYVASDVQRGDYVSARDCALQVQASLDIAGSLLASAERILEGDEVELESLDVWWPDTGDAP